MSSTPPLPFERLGPYRIDAWIGGGMAHVYKGYDESLGRVVAVKVLPNRLSREEALVRRFRAEATAAAKVTHPNVVPIHFIGEEAGHHFFGMQYVEGESLAERLAHQSPIPLEEALGIIEQCLAGLGAAHAQGLVHGNVKPGNVLLDSKTGRAVL
ncbi:MAG: serine/threonine-protein kinase, partial [Planctomycetota bacterium]